MKLSTIKASIKKGSVFEENVLFFQIFWGPFVPLMMGQLRDWKGSEGMTRSKTPQSQNFLTWTTLTCICVKFLMKVNLVSSDGGRAMRSVTDEVFLHERERVTQNVPRTNQQFNI